MRVVKGDFGKGRTGGAGGSRPGKKTATGFSMAPLMGEHEYQASEFFVPSKDAQGHSVKVTTMVTPDTKREIQTILSRRAIPLWDTEGDLIRWCIHYGLISLMKRLKDPHIRSAHAVMTSWAEIQKEQAEETYWTGTLFPNVRRRVGQMVKNGDFIPAQRLLKLVENMVESIGDDYWRQKFEKEIIEYYSWVRAKAKAQERRLRREHEE